jgi:polysaccharide biosynthesis protein PelD
MEFLALYGQIEAGGIYEYIDGPRPEVRKRASVGLSEPPDAQHPMVRRAIESKQSVHLLDQLADRLGGQELMAVMPMFDERGEVLGVLTINRLPFMAFNADNLRNLWVLLQAYADFCRLRADFAVLQKDWPDAPLELRQEWTWLSRMHRTHGVPSVCAVWQLTGAQAASAASYLRLAHEQGNMAWVLGPAAQPSSVVTLLPFLSPKRFALLQEHMRAELNKRFGSTVLVACTAIDLSAEHALAQVKQLHIQESV